jgi:AcrR family transcriptional regulator
MTAKPVEARERISGAAFRLFGKKGYTRTSVQDIADAAAVKKSIVYYYFGSKEGLYQALLSQSAEHLGVFLQQAVAAVDLAPAGLPRREGEAQLCAIAEVMITQARENREPVRFFLTHIFAPDTDRPPGVSDQLEQLPRRLINQIAVSAVHSGELVGDPSEIERLVLGAVQYSIIRHLRNPEQEPLAAGLGQRIVRAAVRGFLASRSPASHKNASTPSAADADPV